MMVNRQITSSNTCTTADGQDIVLTGKFSGSRPPLAIDVKNITLQLKNIKNMFFQLHKKHFKNMHKKH